MKIFQGIPIKIAFLVFLISPNLGCLGTAKISSFPTSISQTDFENYSRKSANTSSKSWTFETTDEFYFERTFPSSEYSEIRLISQIEDAFGREGYTVQMKDTHNKRIIGRRGLQADEWNSLVGIYYNFNVSENMLQVYIKTEITQDFTGGPNKQRSKRIGNILQMML